MLYIKRIIKQIFLICLVLFLVSCDGSSTLDSNTQTNHSQSITMDDSSGGISNHETDTSLVPLIVLKDTESKPDYDLNANTVVLVDGKGHEVPVNDLTLEQDSNTYYFSPETPLKPDTTYEIKTTTGDNQNLGSFSTGEAVTPMVAMLRPRNNALNIALDVGILFQFSEDVFNVDTSTVTIHEGSTDGPSVPFQFLLSSANDTYQIVLDQHLKEQTKYFVVLNSNIVDADGISLDTTVFNFTTGDFTKPEVTMLSPVDNAVNVSNMPILQFKFSEAVNGVAANTSVILHKDSPDGAIVQLSNINLGDDHVYSISPSTELAQMTRYYLEINDKIKDNKGLSLNKQVFSFVTGSIAPPTASILSPANNAERVSRNPNIQIKFNESVVNVDTDNVTLHQGSESGPLVTMNSVIAGTDNTYIFNPSNELLETTRYYVVLNDKITNLSGSKLTKTVFSFTTGETTAPTVSLFEPVNGSTNVVKTPIMTLAFSEPVMGVDNTNVEFHKDGVDGPLIATSPIVEGDNNTYSFAPRTVLAEETKYYIVVKSNIEDLYGNKLVEKVFSFTTGETIAPTVSMLEPINGSTNVVRTPIVTLAFSEIVIGVDQQSVELRQGSESGLLLNTSRIVEGYDHTYSFAPQVVLLPTTKYYVIIKPLIHDLSNNYLANQVVFSFTTL